MPSLLATLGLNTTPFKRNLVQSTMDAKHAGREFAEAFGELAANKLGAVGGAYAITSLIEKTVETVDHIKELSEQFRVSTDTIQLWDRAAARVGMTADDIGNAFNRLKKAREGAVAKGDVGGFGAFGISMEELKNSALSTEDIMSKIRAASEGHPITDAEDVAGMELMGRSGAKVLSAMEQLSNLGPVHLIPKEDIDNLHEANERIKELNRDFQAGTAIAAGFGLKLTNKLGDLVEFFKGTLSLKEALNPEAADKPVPAPDFDLKGRPLKIHGEATKDEEARIYRVTKTVNLNKDLAEVEKLRDELAKRIAENQLKGMSATERIAELERQITEHKRKFIEFRFGEGDEKQALEEDLEAERLRGQLTDLQDKQKSKFRYQAPDANERVRIGAYGPQGIELSAASASVKSEHHLSDILQELRGHTKMIRRTKY
jgi:hypothetical protein